MPLDRLLTIISIYWFGNSLDASLRIYKENRLNPIALADFPPVEVPFSVAHFPKELPPPPRSWVERGLRVVRWTEMPRGGHFAALEQPELLAEDLRAPSSREAVANEVRADRAGRMWVCDATAIRDRTLVLGVMAMN
ncbi:hypothetical protein [Mesorhizobium sp. WSM2239]|uniref:Epoxide hydrolase n=2 Tax=unclassified Mesorhizobium TaxID=325217 RepID=A0AAU8D638_9HYPH